MAFYVFLVDNDVIPDETLCWLRVFILFESQKSNKIKYKGAREASLFYI